jgi:hypothetical protein
LKPAEERLIDQGKDGEINIKEQEEARKCLWLVALYTV